MTRAPHRHRARRDSERRSELDARVDTWLDGRRLRIVRARAREYAAHGWPVARLAVPYELSCVCSEGRCLTPHLLDDAVITDAELVDKVWDDPTWDIALVTVPFEVMELPAHLGAPLHQMLKTACPTAFAPRGRRWYFFLSPASVAPADVDASGGSLHQGEHEWIPAPGTWTESTERIRWLVHPSEAHWQPHRRMDAIARVLSQ